MAEKMIKHLLYTYFVEVEDPAIPGGRTLREKIARLGQVVDVPRDADVARGESLGSFYTDEERAQIEDGTYRGIDAETVFDARSAQPASTPAMVTPALGEGINISALSADQVGDYIRENKLNVEQTVALATDDEDSINKVLDAENFATDNEPRKGVTERLEAKLAAVAQA